jgi:hypothetical protein
MPFCLPSATIYVLNTRFVFFVVLIFCCCCAHTYPVMNNTSKNRKLGPCSEVTGVSFVNEAKVLLARCLVSLDNIYGAYYYEVIGTASIPGSLSHLLCFTDQQLMTIYRYSYGFYKNVKRNCFPDTIFQAFIEGLNVLIDITRYKRPASPIGSLLVMIGRGSYLSKPLHQAKDQLQPPNHRLRKEERQLLAACAIRLNGQTDRVIRTVRITIRTRTVAIPQ